MKQDDIFYFANLGADVIRCANAARDNNENRYRDSLVRAHKTLKQLQNTDSRAAYEEGVLMIRGLELARATPEELASFRLALDSLMCTISARLAPSFT